MAQVIIFAIDLGTSALTGRTIRVFDRLDGEGNVSRQKFGSRPAIEMKDWPGGHKGDAIGKACLPTDLVYDRATRKLLFWGFEAQRYLDDPHPEISTERVFVVPHIKLLLPDPDRAKLATPATARYRIKREEVIRVLGKQPSEIFQDFMNPVIHELVKSATRYYGNFNSHQVELVLAFPSGWAEYIHTEVAAIGARAMEKALKGHRLSNMTFGIQNVYTLSETLCGVKEWLGAAMDDAISSIDLDIPPTNIDELEVGDCFLPVDIGGGTGCLTPLKLVSKAPLQVDQIGPTKSLEVSGEAVEAEFERFLRSIVTADDYEGDIERLISRICRGFKEEKKDCSPGIGSSTWNLQIAKLRANPSKGFYEDVMKLNRNLLDRCFDPVIDKLEVAIKQALKERPAIKAIVFLGQFGGSSAYLRKRMARSSVARVVKLRHSQTGKMDVVKGALSERQQLQGNFVRKSETAKSYGTLITLPWGPGQEGTDRFPDAVADGAVEFEHHADGNRLVVVEWAIPKGTIVEKNVKCDVGKDGRRHHIWKFGEKNIEFEDIIIVSDEIPPVAEDGKSYTLWTTAHEENFLVIEGQRIDVQQIPFSWDLSMSEKLSPTGTLLGPYSQKDMESFYDPPKFVKDGPPRTRFRKLEYELVWDITEMQVKTHVRALFPGAVGPVKMQLAKQRVIGTSEKKTGESRSVGLEIDIEISEGLGDAVTTTPKPKRCDTNVSLPVGGPRAITLDDDDDDDEGFVGMDNSRGNHQRESPDLDDFLGGRQLIEGLARQHPHRRVSDTRTPARGSPRPQLRSRSSNASIVEDGLPGQAWRMAQASISSQESGNFRQDGRRREGCWTCKDRKKKCDLGYTFSETDQSWSCIGCARHGIDCLKEEPEFVDDPLMVKLMKEERTKQIRLGKRKARDIEVGGSETRGRSSDRERSFTVTADSESKSSGRGMNFVTGGSSSGPARMVPARGKAIRGAFGRARFL